MNSDSAGEARYPLIDASAADALVVYCPDPRFRAAFQAFVRQRLEIENPILVIVPGGIHDLVTPGREDAARHLNDQLGFMLALTKARRLILFDHDDCLWYKRWARSDGGGEAGDENAELRAAAEKLARQNSGVEVSCFRAQLRDGEIRFESV